MLKNKPLINSVLYCAANSTGRSTTDYVNQTITSIWKLVAEASELDDVVLNSDLTSILESVFNRYILKRNNLNG